ncbi:MAG: OmpH family outer membrane protein [Bacteroidetes bacterium]|nr:OmpH family outer membrane protein [Bacteroidota bacterium]
MMKKGTTIVLGILILAVAGLYILFFLKKEKIGFVRSNELVYSYKGMEEAHALQGKRTKEYQTNIDTLQMDLQKAINNYNMEFSKLSKEERAEKEKMLIIQKENFQNYSQNAQKAIEKSNTDLTEGVLNQINAFVEKYAKENNYTIIFGTTTSGNVLYGKEEIDVTEEILKALNAQYSAIPNQEKK